MTNTSSLTWSEPAATGYVSVEATADGREWRLVPVPGDVTRVHFTGHDADGTIVCSTTAPAYAESLDEAKIVADILHAGTDHLPDWREQLEAAGFVRTHPDAAKRDILHRMWHDVRSTGSFDVTVYDRAKADGYDADQFAVESTYQASGSNSWHNVTMVDGSPHARVADGATGFRGGLPEGVCGLKAGVAAAIAIRDARRARGGSFAVPLGGPTRKRTRR